MNFPVCLVWHLNSINLCGGTLQRKFQAGTNAASQNVRPGERSNFEGKAVGNSILLAIPEEEFTAIRNHLEFHDLSHYTVLHEARKKMEYAYFLNSGMASLVFKTNHGESVEVGVIGKEGFTPLPVAAGMRRSPHEVIMQVSGDGFRIGVDELQEMLKTSPQLQNLLSRYATVHGLQTAQTAGCNRLHDLEQRLSRWLLLIQDRVGSGLLRITHDFLAMMLGTDRPSVSLAAGALRRKRIIEYSHGTVSVLNRKKLEGAACECYGLIQEFNAEMAK